MTNALHNDAKTIARVSTVHSEGRFNHLIRCIHNAISSVQSWINSKQVNQIIMVSIHTVY